MNQQTACEYPQQLARKSISSKLFFEARSWRSKMQIGEKYSRSIKVTDQMSATCAVAGTPNVFGTPALVSLIELTAHEAIMSEFDDGQTSVGVSIELKHFSPTPIGMTVRCDVVLKHRDGVFYDFDVNVFDETEPICTCRHRRAVVTQEKITTKAQRKFSITT